jgi:alpha-1,3-glucosyltransferase
MINPAWFALDVSRGSEEELLKVYMRATVLISEFLIYIPALVVFNRKFSRQQGISIWESSIALMAILMQPATILIDHGHFQYNTVMLGFVLASTSSMIANRILWGCVFFVAALCYKQMSLYYAPAVFAYLLGVCALPRFNAQRLSVVAMITAVSFFVMFSPLLLGALYDNKRNIQPTPDFDPSSLPPLLSGVVNFLDPKSWYYPPTLQIVQSIHRIFPFARGLYEDKVANIWCALNTVHKLNVYPKAMAQRVSLFATISFILPACMTISIFPRRELLPWAMASSAWGFFLCSFQVHEKSVLLPLLPMTVLLGSDSGLKPEIRAWVGWANMLGTWTLFPLLKRDELRVPYFVVSLLWAFLLGLPPASLSLYFGSLQGNSHLTIFSKLVHLCFYAAMIIWHFLEAFVEPPEGKPDLWVVINVVIGAAGFGICFLWCSRGLILRSGMMDDYFGVRRRLESKSKKKKTM